VIIFPTLIIKFPLFFLGPCVHIYFLLALSPSISFLLGDIGLDGGQSLVAFYWEYSNETSGSITEFIDQLSDY
jgi:hypothetical protein